MLGGIESLRAAGNFASSPAGLRGRRAKRGGRGARPRARGGLPLALALSPLSRGEGIRQCPGVAAPGFHGKSKPFDALTAVYLLVGVRLIPVRLVRILVVRIRLVRVWLARVLARVRLAHFRLDRVPLVDFPITRVRQLGILLLRVCRAGRRGIRGRRVRPNLRCLRGATREGRRSHAGRDEI